MTRALYIGLDRAGRLVHHETSGDRPEVWAVLQRAAPTSIPHVTWRYNQRSAEFLAATLQKDGAENVEIVHLRRVSAQTYTSARKEQRRA